MTTLNDHPVTINAAPEFSQETLDRGLREMFPGSLVMVLTRDGAEIEDDGYEPQPFLVSSPQSLGQSSTRVVTNDEEIRFGPWEDNAERVDGWEVRAADSTAWVVRGSIIEQPRVGQELFISRRRIVLGIGRK